MPEVARDREVLDVVALDGEALARSSAGRGRTPASGRSGPGFTSSLTGARTGSARPARPARDVARQGSCRPSSTFRSWGSSSRLVRRRKRPTPVTRGSARSLNDGSSSASNWTSVGQQRLGVGAHRAELEHRERPPMEPGPRLDVERRPGPAPADRPCRRAANTGHVSTSIAPAITRSSNRFSSSVERETSQVLYSITGRSATWWSCAAVPKIPRAGGTMLSFTLPPRGRRRRALRSAPRRSSRGRR